MAVLGRFFIAIQVNILGFGQFLNLSHLANGCRLSQYFGYAKRALWVFLWATSYLLANHIPLAVCHG